MGSKCSCLSTQRELRPNTDSGAGSSPTTSQNRRFSIIQSPLRLSDVFITSTADVLYHQVGMKESKEFEDLDLADDEHDTIYSIHETIDYLISGYVRCALNTHHKHCMISIALPIINKICILYYNHHVNDINAHSFSSVILNTLNEEKLVLDLLCDHWNCAPIIHLELLFRGSRDGIDDFKTFHQHCDHKQKLLLIIKSMNDYIFGAFTSIAIRSTTNSVSKSCDKTAFLWSLNTKKIFGINADCIDLENIFHYGKDDEVGIHLGKGTHCNKENSFDFNVDEFIGKQHENGYFKIKEIEAFEVYGI